MINVQYIFVLHHFLYNSDHLLHTFQNIFFQKYKVYKTVRKYIYSQISTKLLKYNDKNELSIRTGMHVFLAKKKNKAPKGYTFHKTKAGDTMYMISQIYGIKLAKLLQYNYMENGEQPQVGEMISLRGPAQLY